MATINAPATSPNRHRLPLPPTLQLKFGLHTAEDTHTETHTYSHTHHERQQKSLARGKVNHSYATGRLCRPHSPRLFFCRRKSSPVAFGILTSLSSVDHVRNSAATACFRRRVRYGDDAAQIAPAAPSSPLRSAPCPPILLYLIHLIISTQLDAYPAHTSPLSRGRRIL